MTQNFTRAELEAIYVLFDKTNVSGIESKQLAVNIMVKAHAAIQEDEKLKAGLAGATKEVKP